MTFPDPIPPGPLDPLNDALPDFDRTIHWAAKGVSPFKAFLSDKSNVHDAMAQLPIWMLMGMTAAIVSIGQLVLPRLGFRPWSAWTISGVSAAIAMLLGLRKIRGWGRPRPTFGAPNIETDPRYRVRAIGDVNALGPLHAAFDPGRDSGFDPAVYFAFFAVAPPQAHVRVVLGACDGVVGGVVCVADGERVSNAHRLA